MRTTIRRFWFALGSILLLLGVARPAQVQGRQEGWQAYTHANDVQGLAVRTSSPEAGGALGGGYTWAATSGGVVCYDAVRYVKFTTADGLADNDVRAVVQDSAGRWWFGTYGGGVSVLHDDGTPFDKGDDTWATFTAADGLAGNDVLAVAAVPWDGGGQLWFGTESGVSVLDHGGTPFDKRDDTWTTFTTADSLVDGHVHAIAAVAWEGGGLLWFGTEGGVSVLDNGGTPFDRWDDTWMAFTPANGLAHPWVYAVAEDSEGRLWFGTEGGVSVLDHGGTPFAKRDDTWATFTAADGLASNVVYAVVEDSEGRMWFGTHGGGVSVLDHGGTPFDKGDDAWGTFTAADGLAGSSVGAAAAGGDGRLWFGTGGGGVSALDDGGTPFDKGDDAWTTFATADGLAHSDDRAIAIDGEGRLWFGTARGVSVLDNGGTPFDEQDDTWTTFTRSDGLADDNIFAVAEDGGYRLGRWWFGSWYGAGVGMLDDGGTPFDKGDDVWATFAGPDGLADNSVSALAVDSDGQIWFGTLGGVSVLDDGGTPLDKGDDVWAAFSDADGLADNDVRAIVEDSGGRMWFGTWGGGVSVLDHGGTPFDQGDDAWTTFTAADGLASNNVHAIAAAAWNGERWWWFGTEGGVSVLDDGGTPFDQGDDTWTTFSTADGLAGGGVKAIVVDRRGRVWFGTWGGGVSVLDDGGTPFDKGDDTWTAFSTADGLADNEIRAVAVDGEGWMWFGTRGGAGELVDAVPPLSSARSPAYMAGPIPISWAASDGASGIFCVSLWVKYGSGGTWVESGLQQRGRKAGTFSYMPTQGDGTYYLATVAEDWMGNVEAPPTGSGDTHTFYRASGSGDAYEEDDACARARAIPADGTVQVHTFHDQGDADWVTFGTTAGTTYLIEAQIPAGSAADVAVEVYDECGGEPQDDQDHDFAPGVRIKFQATADGPLYLKLVNHDSVVYGALVAYHLSVRALGDVPAPGAAVIVAGKWRDHDPLQSNIHHVTDTAYRLFLAHGYGGDHIHYLATKDTLDPDGDGTPDVDGLPTRANLEQAITQWAVGRVGPGRPFTLYLMDHGEYDLFYLNGDTHWLAPELLDSWLDALEGAAPGVEVNVIVEACRSGSFIDLARTVSQGGRLVITSTSAWTPAWASAQGAVFSDPFLQALANGMSLYASFEEAWWAVQRVYPDQTPWLDDDGDGFADMGEVAARRGFGSARTLGDAWAPWVVWARVGEGEEGKGATHRSQVHRTEKGEGLGAIEAEVRDDKGVSAVWAVVYPPSYRPPEEAEELVLEDLPTVALTDADGDGVYSATYDGFDEVGTYRVVVYARDKEGLIGRPRDVEAHDLYLPLVVR